MNSGTALARIADARNKGAMVFANAENCDAKVDLYRTEVTELQFKAEDFHALKDKFMPSKAATDRIGEACGIQFIQSACRVCAESREDDICGKRTVYCAEAQGRVRMPDGSWRYSTVDEYEFDPVLRAMLDKNVTELNEQTKKTVGRTILEFSKIARQRAATGARLRVIRQLTGMPSAFTQGDAQKPMVFARIVQNTGYILQTPEGRAMATAQALGVDIASLYGGKQALPQAETEAAGTDGADEARVIHAEIVQAEEGAAEAQTKPPPAETIPDFEDMPPANPPKQPDEFEKLTMTLVEYLEGYANELNVVMPSNGLNPFKLVEEELNNPNATTETHAAMIERTRAYLLKKGCRV